MLIPCIRQFVTNHRNPHCHRHKHHHPRPRPGYDIVVSTFLAQGFASFKSVLPFNIKEFICTPTLFIIRKSASFKYFDSKNTLMVWYDHGKNTFLDFEIAQEIWFSVFTSKSLNVWIWLPSFLNSNILQLTTSLCSTLRCPG